MGVDTLRVNAIGELARSRTELFDALQAQAVAAREARRGRRDELTVGSIRGPVQPYERKDRYPWLVEVQFEALIDPPLSRDKMREDPILQGYRPYTTGNQATQFMLPHRIAARTEELVTRHLTRLAPSPAAPPVAPPSRPDEAAPPTTASFGDDYQLANEDYSASIQELIRPDTGLINRANQMHAKLQNDLAGRLAAKHLVPRSYSYGQGEPNFDIAWMQGDTIFVTEIKSLTAENEEMQLRLGLAQVLMYRHRLARMYPGVKIRAVLLVEREPTFKAWEPLCTELEVLLVWPANLDRRLQ